MNRVESATLPATCGVAFKEWEGVCDALATGRQSLILRKGGIEEGPGGFVPEHRVFWLYPTRVHQARQGLKPGSRDSGDATPDDTIGLSTLAVVEVIGRVERLEQLSELSDLHVWTAETVESRFHYRRPGLWALGVRVYRRDSPFAVPVTPDHAGCKSWVPLEEARATKGLVEALDGREFEARMGRLSAIVGGRPDVDPA